MPIGMTDDQQSLAEAIGDWARGLDAAALVKASEEGGPQAWERALAGLADLGIAGIAVPEEFGGAGGSLVDLAVAVEAAARAMVPGGLLGTAVGSVVLAEHPDSAAAKTFLPGISEGTVRVALAVRPTTLVEHDGTVSGVAPVVAGIGSATHLLAPYDGDAGWVLLALDADGVTTETATPVDLSTRVGSVHLDGVEVGADGLVPLSSAHVRAVAATLAAAEAAGIARWCLDTAVEYAKVREQFGRTIGSFQSIKHLCAEMLEASESATAVAWDAATAYPRTDAAGDEQFAIAAAIAGSVALDLGVEAAQSCIQVLGGIGYTWEHDAHLYLRRSMVLRQLLGGTDAWRLRLADLALSGVRRVPHLELDQELEPVRAAVRSELAEVAALPESERRAALADSGLLMPHWPAPYGRGAGPQEQIVIDEEYAAAGVERPSLNIGAWAAPTILVHGDDAQREKFLRPTLHGEISWCQLFSEPGAGSDLASLRTRAERTEGGWLLTGQKVWTSNAHQADWGICLARTNPDVPQHKGISYFLVEMSTPGIEIRPLREMTGEALFNEVFLDNVFVPDELVVGEVDGGWALARNTLANERVALSDSSFGVSVERILRTASRQDEVGEVLRLRIGESVADAGTVKALGTRSTLRSLAGDGPGPESSVLKLVGVRQRQDSAETALDLLADDVLLGSGEAADAVQEALVTRCLSIAGGTTQVLRNVAGERILGLPRG